MHIDLFDTGHSTDEVYRALCEHQARDARTLRILDIATAAALIGALTDFNGWGMGLWVAAAFLGLSSTRYFVDTSNRNFLMHRMDWDAAALREAAKR
ncbi:hypothetical protein QP164_00150 [Sphingomonas sp. LR59]|uniref:hypothetical protein n=1 Tax=Sphingomonas sp. LR59 TaxID=3050232 RepID=UPI002FE1C29A